MCSNTIRFTLGTVSGERSTDMLTPAEQRAATRHLAMITSYDSSAGTLTAQVLARAQCHSDAAARIWIAHMAKASVLAHRPSPYPHSKTSSKVGYGSSISISVI